MLNWCVRRGRQSYREMQRERGGESKRQMLNSGVYVDVERNAERERGR